MGAETLLQELNENGAYELRGGGYWAVWPDLDVHAMAAMMLAHCLPDMGMSPTWREASWPG